MRRPSRALLLASALGLSACTKAGDPSARTPVQPAPSQTPAQGLAAAAAPQLAAGISAAAAYLDRSCDEAGRFVYLRHARGERVSAREYNVLRHAGAGYALAQHHATSGSPRSRAALLRAARYLRERHLRPLSELGEGVLAVLSLPDEEVKGPAPQAKLGGAGLGLVTLCAARELEPDAVSLAELRGLGAFVRVALRADGSFHSKYLVGRGWDEEFVSRYYPGEAILGLTRLAAHDPQGGWLTLAARAACALAQRRRGLPRAELPHDHWLLIGGSALLAQAPAELRFERRLLRAHLRELGLAILASQVDEGPYSGSFHPAGRTAPSATRLEGLAALSSSLDPQDALRARLREAIQRGGAWLLRTQLQRAPVSGSFPAADPRGGLDGERGRVRVDDTQHALSALLGWQALSAAERARPR